MTVLAGLRSGIRSGLRAGLNPSDGGVDLDATSGIYVPSTAAQWTELGLTAPNALWLLQDASGNPADSIGTYTLTASGTAPTYESAVAGWSRKAILLADGADTLLANTDTGLPDISTTSCLLLAYVISNSTPAARRTLTCLGTTSRILARLEVTGVHSLLAGATAQAGGTDTTGQVRPVVTKIDRTGSAEALYSDLEKLTVVFSTAPTGKTISVSGGGNLAAAAGYLYMAAWFGAAAEMSDATVKTMLQTLGWTIPWS